MLESLLLSRQRSAVTSRQPLPFSSIPACSVFLFPKPSTVRRTSKAFVLLIRSRLLCAGPVLERTQLSWNQNYFIFSLNFLSFSSSFPLLFSLLLHSLSLFYSLLFLLSSFLLFSFTSSLFLLFYIISSSSKYLLVTPLVLKSYRRPCSYVVQCILL